MSWNRGPESYGYAARLNLTSASARDVSSGGYIGAVIWAGTNHNTRLFGSSRRGPFVEAGYTRGFQRRRGTFYFAAYRTTGGRYDEGAGPAKLGENLPFELGYEGVVGSTTWHAAIGAEKPFATFRHVGALASSAYTGIESSSPRNTARASVSKVYVSSSRAERASRLPSLAGTRYRLTRSVSIEGPAM